MTIRHTLRTALFWLLVLRQVIQKVLNRLKKNQTLRQVKHAITKAKQRGIARTHSFFVIGSPNETKKQIWKSFRFAARLKLDTFSFNRLCVYRGTPLWQEYIDRGIIDDLRDWSKWFKCSDIDSTILPSKELNRARMRRYAFIFAHRIFCHPIKSYKLLRTLCPAYENIRHYKTVLQPFSPEKADLQTRFAGQNGRLCKIFLKDYTQCKED